MITREQVADLLPGDVVEIWHEDWPQGTALTGPIYEHSAQLRLGSDVIRFSDGDILARYARGGHLTVISRAPRPLYVNHDRTEPVPGDVVRDADSDNAVTWTKNVDGFSHEWLCNKVHVYVPREEMPDRLRLLVDGETGRCVP